MERWNQQGNCYPRGDMPRGNEWLSKLAREFIKPLNNLQAYPGSEEEWEKERHKKKETRTYTMTFCLGARGVLINHPNQGQLAWNWVHVNFSSPDDIRSSFSRLNGSSRQLTGKWEGLMPDHKTSLSSRGMGGEYHLDRFMFYYLNFKYNPPRPNPPPHPSLSFKKV